MFEAGDTNMIRVGDRVGAVLSADLETKTVKLLGYGRYMGRDIPSAEAVGFMAEYARQQELDTPVLYLDDGGIVFGCECFWEREESIKQKIQMARAAGFKVVQRDMGQVRQVYRGESA
jgi:hypothetical protein